MRILRRVFASLALLLPFAVCVCAEDTPVYFSPDPGAATVEVRPDGFVLRNAAVSLSGRVSGGRFETPAFLNRMVGGIQQVPMLPFALLLGDASRYVSQTGVGDVGAGQTEG